MILSVLIGGDVAPTNSNIELFQNGEALWDSSVLALRSHSDIAVLNLECPLTDSSDPIEKCGPNMRAPLFAVKGLTAFKPDAVGLANNHILDYGPKGLEQTRKTLADEGILTFGAGKNLDEADTPLFIERKGLKIGFYGVAEHEFSYAGISSPGANPLDLLEISERIQEIRKKCDYLIVLYHGGREYYPYPSPELQKTCRKIASSGADAVFCQHSHCIGSAERFAGAEILYGQGNFLFDAQDADDSFRTGLLVRIQIDENREGKIQYLPVQTRDGRCVLIEGRRKESLLKEFEERSERISDSEEVERLYQDYSAKYREKMMKVFLSGNPLLKTVNILYGRKPSRVYDRNTRMAILNSMRCESLRELLSRTLE